MISRLRTLLLCAVLVLGSSYAQASKLFIPMDAEGQANHLKAYGIAYAAMQANMTVDWLLNYKGGSFAMDDAESIVRLCKLRGVTYEILGEAEYTAVITEVANPDFNGDIIKLEKAPKIAVYTPPNKEPWDDAVTLALTYAEIPFDKVYDD